MDRNKEMQHGIVADIDRPRSAWDREFTHKTSFNVGQIVPFYFDMDIIPGTTIKNKTTMVLRLSTPLNPTMDNLYADTYYFKASKFWYWEHFRRMMGENDYGAWTQTIEYTEPKISNIGISLPTWGHGDFASYIGVRQGTENLAWSKLAINMYIDIWNQWFRDQNLQAPIIIDKTDTTVMADGTISTGFGLLNACRFHDYFSACLPQPQKGGPISTPLGISAPIVGNGVFGLTRGGTDTNHSLAVTEGTGNAHPIVLGGASPSGASGNSSLYYGTGLQVDLTNATAATINALRLAFATQRILERDSMAGTRYRELLRAHYGSTPDDEAILTPEYLGGHRIPINIETVLQNSSTDSTSPLGYTGAVSVTLDVNEDFTKSFMKDDMLMGLVVIRADHTYQQGLPRQLTRLGRLDRYWPELSHIGNQPVYNYEIYAQGNTYDDGVFGYKEAWQEYMYKPNMITGMLNSEYAQSLDTWHYGDDYSSLPVLSSNWIQETPTYVDRTLAVQSTTADQIIADILVEQHIVAPIPLHRTPGLIDHF